MSSVARPIGDLDLHLFGEGTHRRLWELLGPQALHVDADGAANGVRLSVWAPNASAVGVVGDWNDWQAEPLAMLDSDGPTGIWSTVAPHARSGHRYKFRIVTGDGRVVHKADPLARQAELPPSDASVVPTCAGFEWADDEWLDRRARTLRGEDPLRVYEVHLGSWHRDARTWSDLAERLADHVSALGFTHVEVLPIAEHPFGGSWGYQVSGYYAPTARFGDPDGFRRFVDVLHRRGIGVIVDWVPAHFPRDEWSLGRFDGTPLYEHPDPRRGEHPEWGTYVFDYGRNQVRNFLVANALYWFDEFHVDGLRVDAVASMLHLDDARGPGEWTPNEHGGREHLEAVAFLQEMNSVVGEEFPDVLMIAEDSTAWPGVTSPVSAGGLGFSHKWNLGWMNDTLGYLSHDPDDRADVHHDLALPLGSAFDERFVLPLSHDEVVHGKGSLLARMGGDDPVERFAALRVLLAWQWSVPGAPLVFMGTELAAEQEWDEAEGLPWHLLREAPHRGVYDLIGGLNASAAAWPALWRRDHDPGGFEWLDAHDACHSVYSFLRWDLHGEAAVVCVANLGRAPRPGYRVGLPWAGEWEVVLDTDDERWSGAGVGPGAASVLAADEPCQGRGSSAVIDVAALSAVWLAARAPR